jgi:hypothetical protein
MSIQTNYHFPLGFLQGAIKTGRDVALEVIHYQDVKIRMGISKGRDLPPCPVSGHSIRDDNFQVRKWISLGMDCLKQLMDRLLLVETRDDDRDRRHDCDIGTRKVTTLSAGRVISLPWGLLMPG